MEQNLLEVIEWEVLREKIIIPKLTNNSKLPEGSERIEIWRDDSYKICAKLYGKISDFSKQAKLEDGVAGTLVSTFSIEGTDAYKVFKYTLNHCCIARINHNVVYNDSADVMAFEADLIVYELKVQLYKEEKGKVHVDWFLNGPRDSSFMFPRCTERNYSKTYERERCSVDGKSKIYPGDRSQNSDRDFAFIDAGEIKFIIAKIPGRVGPSWSNSICIEYRSEWGEIPGQEIREAIAELTSFVVGKHLLNIGYSIFDSTGQPQEQLALNPWGDNVVSLCQMQEILPIRFSYTAFDRLERILSQTIPKYLVLRNILNLNEALWRYWISSTLPLGTNLPILHAGLEILAKAWFKSNKSKTKGVYILQEKFNKLIEAGRNMIVPQLQAEPYGDRMIRKISNAYQMSQNERLPVFFDEIGLKCGKVENEALMARNMMTHSHSKQTDETINKLLYFTRSYQALFHRIILKVLGFDGNYIDFSTGSWPERNIDEPLAGNK